MLKQPPAQPGILAQWYAEPLSPEQAKTLLSLSVEREQRLLRRFGRPYLSPLLKLIALHWLNEPIEGHYQHLLSRKERSIHAEILKPLIYGQLLMSRRIEGAMDYLDDAFQQARLLLSPEEYFVIMKRHQLLRTLPLGKTKTQGERLESLLTAAAVIERMKESLGERPEFWHDPNDTYG
ncbi:MAG: hypothetical protein ABFS08_07920 [Pseudomonadota bacterium]